MSSRTTFAAAAIAPPLPSASSHSPSTAKPVAKPAVKQVAKLAVKQVAKPADKPTGKRLATRQVKRTQRRPSRQDEPLPAVDDRLVMPETGAEIINGKVYFVAPSDEPHGSTHIDLSAVVRAHLARGYSGAIKMLTRTSKMTDFAPDASVYPTERDPFTGGRKLEEIAFEIASKQSLSVPKRKARELVGRGVRRVFCIVLKKRQVLEWSQSTGSFEPLPNDVRIEDRCFVQPLPVRALLDGAQSDQAIVEALRAREDPTLLAMLKRAYDEGFEKGFEKGIEKGQLQALRQTLLDVMRAKGFTIDEDIRTPIETCSDVAKLHEWIRTIASGNIVDEFARFDVGDPP